MIEVEHVTKRYGPVAVVDDVDLRIPRGGVTSIIGPNGAGKSTLLGVVSRLVPADAGRVRVDGHDVTTTPSRELARRLAILRQDNHLSVRLTVRELVGFGRYPHCRGRHGPEDRAHVESALEYLELRDLAERHLDELSGGQRQRAFVAMVLAQDTDYVLMDEPLNNLDMRHASAMMRRLRDMATDFDKTVVVVLHDINFASFHSDHIVAMRDGRVVAEGPPTALMQREALRSVYDMDIDVQQVNGHRVGIYFA